jgi:hypothetical protein
MHHNTRTRLYLIHISTRVSYCNLVLAPVTLNLGFLSHQNETRHHIVTPRDVGRV